MNKKLHITLNIFISILLLSTVIMGYLPEPELIIELTCISNFSVGLLFLFSAIKMIKGKKDFPPVVYSTALVTIMLVFLVCMGSLSGIYHMNFKGLFLFLHVINPLILLAYYMIFINEKQNGKMRYVLITPLFALLYLFLDYIIGTNLNHYVYGFFEPENLTFGLALIVLVSVYCFLLIIGFTLYNLNCLFQ